MTDPKTLRLVLVFAGIIVLSAMLGGLALAAYDKTLPDALIGLGAGALGLLSGAALPTHSAEPQPVTVQQPAGQPVPVEDTGG